EKAQAPRAHRGGPLEEVLAARRDRRLAAPEELGDVRARIRVVEPLDRSAARAAQQLPRLSTAKDDAGLAPLTAAGAIHVFVSEEGVRLVGTGLRLPASDTVHRAP